VHMEMNTNRPEEVTMSTTHATTVTPAEAPTAYHTGAYRIDCSVCGTVATYRGEQFTIVEARRHEDYFENLEG